MSEKMTVMAKDVKPGDRVYDKDFYANNKWVRVKSVVTNASGTNIDVGYVTFIKHPEEGVEVLRGADRRPGQHETETPAEYLRRVVSNINLETEGLLDDLPSVDAVLDFFDLWSVYDTDFWNGILEGISGGEDPKPARDFIAKYQLPVSWTEDVDEAVEIEGSPE